MRIPCARRAVSLADRLRLTSDSTNAHSNILGSPCSPSRVLSAMRAAAYAILSVALPAPAFASTTSVPASWMREVSALRSASVNDTEGTVCRQQGALTGRSRTPVEIQQPEPVGQLYLNKQVLNSRNELPRCSWAPTSTGAAADHSTTTNYCHSKKSQSADCFYWCMQ